jgi:hypothetical protein
MSLVQPTVTIQLPVRLSSQALRVCADLDSVSRQTDTVQMNKTYFGFIKVALLSLLLLSCGQKSSRSISDIEFSTNPTEQQIKAVWGAPDAFAGYNNRYQVYLSKNEEIWLEYGTNAPYPVTSVFSMPAIGAPVPVKRNRDIQALNFSGPLTYRQVASVWGRPDEFFGSGIYYWLYYLNSGKYASLRFEGKNDLLIDAVLYTPKARHGISLEVLPAGYTPERESPPLSFPQILVRLVPLLVVTFVSISQTHSRKLLIRLLQTVKGVVFQTAGKIGAARRA